MIGSCEALSSSINQWLQYNYQQQTMESAVPIDQGLSHDAISVSTGFRDDDHTFLNSLAMAADSRAAAAEGAETITVVATAPENSCAASSNDLSPKAIAAKPAVRKRSRASRRTPTTLLNTSIKDFRALVQLYTGCRAAAAPIKCKKGPINLSFGPSNEQKPFAAAAPFNEQAHNSQVQNQLYHHQDHIQAYQGQQSLFFGDKYNPSNSGPNLAPQNNFGWV